MEVSTYFLFLPWLNSARFHVLKLCYYTINILLKKDFSSKTCNITNIAAWHARSSARTHSTSRNK
jgi:hypothetical protein